jgi:hypothetical protein
MRATVLAACHVRALVPTKRRAIRIQGSAVRSAVEHLGRMRAKARSHPDAVLSVETIDRLIVALEAAESDAAATRSMDGDVDSLCGFWRGVFGISSATDVDMLRQRLLVVWQERKQQQTPTPDETTVASDPMHLMEQVKHTCVRACYACNGLPFT